MLKENPQESALTIMHFQHAKGFPLVLSNFSFLPDMLQQCLVPNCFFVVKTILLSVVATIQSNQAPQTTNQIHRHRCYYSIEYSFVIWWILLFQYRHRQTEWPLSEAGTFCSLQTCYLWLLCSFRKVILSSIVCCKVNISIFYVWLSQAPIGWLKPG